MGQTWAFLKSKPMSNKEQASVWLKSRIHNFLGANVRTYRWSHYVGGINENVFGGISELQPVEGKIVDIADGFVLTKITPSTFNITSESLLSEPVKVGDKVRLEFYAKRRFDGLLADGSQDPAVGGSRTILLTGVDTMFPVTWEGRYIHNQERHAFEYRAINNPYLRDLIVQMEKIPVNAGRRKVVNILVDAGAKDLRFNDPSENCETPPTIICEVKTAKAEGTLQIRYDRGGDCYEVHLSHAQGPDTVIDFIYFDGLGQVLEDLIDDGSWAKAKVTVLKAAPKKKATATATA